jgi:DNA-directed RNA polymerase subunit N (RpoN/RPB10)
MLIPIRCFTCGGLLSDKWNDYLALCEQYRTNETRTDKETGVEVLDSDGLKDSNPSRMTAEFKALQKLKITRMCCRRHFICNVDLIDVI